MSARPTRGDDGSALVEFVAMVCLLLLPVIYLIAVLSRVQAASFGTQAAARQAAVMLAGAPDQQTARARSDLAVRMALADQGFTGAGDPPAQVEIACDGADCQAPQSVVRVQVRQPVRIPAPRFLQDVWPLEITITSTESAVSDRFRR